jgi:hypothetical protein
MEVIPGSVAGTEEAATRAAEIRASNLPTQEKREQLARLIVPGMTVREAESVLGERNGGMIGWSVGWGGDYWFDRAGICVGVEGLGDNGKVTSASALQCSKSSRWFSWLD